MPTSGLGNDSKLYIPNWFLYNSTYLVLVLYVNEEEEQEFSPEMYSVVKSQLTINPNAYVIPTERRERLKFLKGVNEIHLCSLRVGYVKDTYNTYDPILFLSSGLLIGGSMLLLTLGRYRYSN